MPGRTQQLLASMPPRLPPRRLTSDRGLTELVDAARAGDDRAWGFLVDRLDGMVRSIARSYRLQPADVDDVVQAAWARLHEHINRLREPAAARRVAGHDGAA